MKYMRNSMRNSNTPKPALESESNVIYRFECTVGSCRGRNVDYIGLTTSTLKKRMENHRYNGGIHGHFKAVHNRRPTTKELVENSTILHRVASYHRLAITEAVSIELRKPLLNIQREFDLVLPSCRRKKRELETLTEDPPPAAPGPRPADPPQPAREEGGRGENAPLGVASDNQQELPQTTEYVRQRLRPRTQPTMTT